MIVGFFQTKSKTVAVCGCAATLYWRGTRMQDDAPKKEKRPRPSRFQAAALPPGSAATSRPATAATSRPAVSAWRALAGSASAGGLKHPSVRSCQSAGPVCGSTSATTAAATDAPAARTAPLATGASNLVRALAAKRMIEPYGLRRARPASLVLSPAVPGARASAGSHRQQAPDRRFWPRESPSVSSRGLSATRAARHSAASTAPRKPRSFVLSRTIVAVAVGGVARRSCICSCRTT